jgi:hypothetical protein
MDECCQNIKDIKGWKIIWLDECDFMVHGSITKEVN